MRGIAVCIVIFIIVLISSIGYGSTNNKITRAELDVITAPLDDRLQAEVDEVVQLWNLYLDDDLCFKNKKLRSKFPQLAEQVVKFVHFYQRNSPTIGGRLPGHPDMHLLIAVIIAEETSIRARTVGTRGEVGLMQVWGVARANQRARHVRQNAALGILLGVRWLAYCWGKCHAAGYTDKDLLGPLSIYGAGPKTIVNGRCTKVYKFARDRVKLMQEYRSRIRQP